MKYVARKQTLYLIVAGLVAAFIAYNWLLFASDWSEDVLRVTVLSFVLAILAIIGIIFGSMAFSYPAPKLR